MVVTDIDGDTLEVVEPVSERECDQTFLIQIHELGRHASSVFLTKAQLTRLRDGINDILARF